MEKIIRSIEKKKEIIERKDESERIDKALKEVEESFKEVGDKLDDAIGDKFDAAVVHHIDFMQMTNQGDAIKIDSSELSDPMTQNIKGKVFKMTYKSLIEV
ncbi:hypothetical protein F8M41_021099 [Gigaspora margarita]|uniref:Uncharacterized protein n=1 Tax=Gigaspora margarita TaxID=4874 RepID=A0A8H4AHE2_GIGMA|nr:hypothetical protein F8M41_021099 [Gigaspora margarita]